MAYAAGNTDAGGDASATYARCKAGGGGGSVQAQGGGQCKLGQRMLVARLQYHVDLFRDTGAFAGVERELRLLVALQQAVRRVSYARARQGGGQALAPDKGRVDALLARGHVVAADAHDR